jgi:hypothetical protein
VHLPYPEQEAVHDELLDERVVAVEAVARAGEVQVVLAVGFGQQIVNPVVDPPEADRRAVLVALGRVAEDDVEDDLDAGAGAAP